MITVKQALQYALEQLKSHPEARIDAEVIVAHVLNQTRSFLYAHPETPLTKTQHDHFNTLIEQRRQGMPIAYLTGKREFWSLPLNVNRSTLIPRPETELLVELVLQLQGHLTSANALDLGTGSGAIALALASEKPNWTITACDHCNQALTTAETNAKSLRINTIRFLLSDWFSAIDSKQKFDVIVSNPPYIAPDDPHLQQGDVRFEPLTALVSPGNGISFLRYIIQHSLARLSSNGLLLIEHGYQQKSIVHSMLREYGYQQITSWQDVQGNDRVSGGRRKTVGGG